ncbi:hypothetical protein GCK32_007999 [Trichostrongylus colubriformis]|uniref:CCHC-type domain-containing protein n=1 Tax=Trichostrongylus colubriformis TaxID=6319 RepID=A0AAN8G099_TRICO
MSASIKAELHQYGQQLATLKRHLKRKKTDTVERGSQSEVAETVERGSQSEVPETEETSSVRNDEECDQSVEEIDEELLDLLEELYESADKQEKESPTKAPERKGPNPKVQELKQRMQKILQTVGTRNLTRKFTQTIILRPEERYLRCGFCDAKGEHYSDSCPQFRTVEERRRMIRCKFCLDTMHSSRNCTRPMKRCKYCRLENHHTAICA